MALSVLVIRANFLLRQGFGKGKSEAAEEFIREYEAKWLDEAIPALDSPPRQAADDPTRLVRSTAPRRSHFMRRHAAAAVWDEAPQGEPWTATLYASPSSHPCAMSTPTTTPC